MVKKERWKPEPDDHDYPAAVDFLSLLLETAVVEVIVEDLHQAAIVDRKAKDLLRASGLALLSNDNKHVAKDLARVAAGERLSPVLLVRGNLSSGQPLTVADGYHRICASYHLDENADIPCRLVSCPQSP